MESDPSGLVGGLNTYLYALAIPNMYADFFALSTLNFNRSTGTITVTPKHGTAQTFPAANNTASTSRGPWKDGTYPYYYYKAHKGDAHKSSPVK